MVPGNNTLICSLYHILTVSNIQKFSVQNCSFSGLAAYSQPDHRICHGGNSVILFEHKTLTLAYQYFEDYLIMFKFNM